MVLIMSLLYCNPKNMILIKYFICLSPLLNSSDIQESQQYSDELLASYQRGTPLPLGTIPDISDWISSLEIKIAMQVSEFPVT